MCNQFQLEGFAQLAQLIKDVLRNRNHLHIELVIRLNCKREETEQSTINERGALSFWYSIWMSVDQVSSIELYRVPGNDRTTESTQQSVVEGCLITTGCRNKEQNFKRTYKASIWIRFMTVHTREICQFNWIGCKVMERPHRITVST